MRCCDLSYVFSFSMCCVACLVCVLLLCVVLCCAFMRFTLLCRRYDLGCGVVVCYVALYYVVVCLVYIVFDVVGRVVQCVVACCCVSL